MLTEENKVQFEKWYSTNNITYKYDVLTANQKDLWFNELPFEMKRGIYEAYLLQEHNLHLEVLLNEKLQAWRGQILAVDGKFNYAPLFTFSSNSIQIVQKELIKKTNILVKEKNMGKYD